MSRTVFVGDLSYFTTEVQLMKYMSSVGKVSSVQILRGSCGESLLHGFVKYESEQGAYGAVHNLHNVKFMGRRLIVNSTNTKAPKKTYHLWNKLTIHFTTDVVVEVNEEVLDRLCCPFGEIGDTVVRSHVPLQAPDIGIAGYAVVFYLDAAAAQRACEYLNKMTINHITFQCSTTNHTIPANNVVAASTLRSSAQRSAGTPRIPEPPKLTVDLGSSQVYEMESKFAAPRRENVNTARQLKPSNNMLSSHRSPGSFAPGSHSLLDSSATFEEEYLKQSLLLQRQNQMLQQQLQQFQLFGHGQPSSPTGVPQAWSASSGGSTGFGSSNATRDIHGMEIPSLLPSSLLETSTTWPVLENNGLGFSPSNFTAQQSMDRQLQDRYLAQQRRGPSLLDLVGAKQSPQHLYMDKMSTPSSLPVPLSFLESLSQPITTTWPVTMSSNNSVHSHTTSSLDSLEDDEEAERLSGERYLFG